MMGGTLNAGTPDKHNYQRLSSIVSERSRREQNTIGRKDAGEYCSRKYWKKALLILKQFFLAVFYLDRRYYRMC